MILQVVYEIPEEAKRKRDCLTQMEAEAAIRLALRQASQAQKDWAKHEHDF